MIQPGVSNALAQNVDLFPTVRALAGLDEADGSALVLDGDNTQAIPITE